MVICDILLEKRLKEIYKKKQNNIYSKSGKNFNYIKKEIKGNLFEEEKNLENKQIFAI